MKNSTIPTPPPAAPRPLTLYEALYGLMHTVRANAQARPDRYMAEELIMASLEAAEKALEAAKAVTA